MAAAFPSGLLIAFASNIVNEEKIETQAVSRAGLNLARGIIVAIVAVSLAAMIIPLLAQRHRDAAIDCKVVDAVPAQVGSVSETVTAFGKLTVRRYADVVAQISGQVKEIHAPIGEVVMAGRTLVEISPAVENQRLEEDQAQLARLRAELADQSAQREFAKLQFQRQTRLMADNATREENVESSKTSMLSNSAKVDAIQAQIEQAEAMLKQDEGMLTKTRIVAPMSGTIVDVAVHKGQVVNANQTTLLRIADLSELSVVAHVDEKNLGRLGKGMPAYFTAAAFPGRRWQGKLNQILPLPIDDGPQPGKSTYYAALFDVANPDHALMSGMSVAVDFVVARVENAVTIPIRMLPDLNEKNEGILQVLDKDGKLSPRRVTIGLKDAQHAQVTSGLHQGERVVLANQNEAAECIRRPRNA